LSLFGVLELEVLVRELGAVDALSAGSVTPGEITTLDHELLDDAVESRSLVAKALLASSQGTEVFCGLVIVSMAVSRSVKRQQYTFGTVPP